MTSQHDVLDKPRFVLIWPLYTFEGWSGLDKTSDVGGMERGDLA